MESEDNCTNEELKGRPYRRWRSEELTIPGTKRKITLYGHSISAESTSFHLKELDILVDCGSIENGTKQRKAKNVFLTHTHTDHAKEAFMFVTRRFTANFFLPNESVPFFEAFMKAAHYLNASRVSTSGCEMKVTGFDGGETQPLSGKLYADVFKAFHKVPALGFGFYEMKNSLKEEYQKLTGKEIGRLSKEGADIYIKSKTYLIAFTGDTTTRMFVESPEILKYPFIVSECTHFLPGDEEQAEKNGHVHWSLLLPFVQQNPSTVFILTHFSFKHTIKEIKDFFDKQSCKNIIVWVDDVK